MARIAGVDLPVKKRAAIGLTYIYGIGRTRASSILYRAGVDPDKKVGDLSRRGGQPHPPDHRRGRRGRGRPAQGDLDEPEAAHRDGLLSAGCGTAAGCRCAASARTPTPARARVRAAEPSPTRRSRRRRRRRTERGEQGYARITVWRRQQRKQARRRFSRRRKRRSCPWAWCTSRPPSTTPSSASRIPPGNVVGWSSAGLARVPRVPKGHSLRRAAGVAHGREQGSRIRTCGRSRSASAGRAPAVSRRSAPCPRRAWKCAPSRT